jgi:hypothetical protein
MTKHQKISPTTAAKIILIGGPTARIEVGGFRPVTIRPSARRCAPVGVFPNRHQVGKFRTANRGGSGTRSRS